jgi:hypothetical protein
MRFNITNMSDQKATLSQAIEAQGLKVRQLKSQAAEKSVIDAEVQTLLGLKKELAALEGGAANGPAAAGKPACGKAAKSNFTLKTAKVRGAKNACDLQIFII